MPTVIPESPWKDYLDPAKASVFDSTAHSLLRTANKWLGLTDPNQVMAVAGTPMETGASTGGLLEAVKGRLPRFMDSLTGYKGPTSGGQVAQPFYSRLDDAAATLPKSTFGPKIAGFTQKGLTSADEMTARGVPQFVEQAGNKPVTREALQAHLAANPAPQIEVKTLGGDGLSTDVRNAQKAFVDYHQDLAGRYNNIFTDATPEELAQHTHLKTKALAQTASVQPTKFSQYQLPGGENYRETLLTLPPGKDPLPTPEALQKWYGNRYGAPMDSGEAAQAIREDSNLLRQFQSEEPTTLPQFTSSHFDEPNILVHTRSNERLHPELGKGHFLEEVQSDWHQKGKAEGYRNDAPRPTAMQVDVAYSKYQDALRDYYHTDNPEMKALGDRAHDEWNTLRKAYEDGPPGVPDAPFKDTWPDLALKHHLVEAAQNPEHNWLGFTSGATQDQRYHLSHTVDQLHWYPGNVEQGMNEGTLEGFKQGARVFGMQFEPDQLGAHVGQEVAKKLVGTQPVMHNDWFGPRHSLTGEELNVGGAGMKEFYDNQLPRKLNKLVAPLGGKVERMTGRSTGNADMEGAWMVRLPPELKQRILKYGFPLMTGAAAIAGEDTEK